MTDHIIIQVDDKPGLLEFLQAEQTSAQQYADLCLSVLVEDWGADPAKIDKIGLLESCLGHLIHCEVEGVRIGSPKIPDPSPCPVCGALKWPNVTICETCGF